MALDTGKIRDRLDNLSSVNPERRAFPSLSSQSPSIGSVSLPKQQHQTADNADVLTGIREILNQLRRSPPAGIDVQGGDRVSPSLPSPPVLFPARQTLAHTPSATLQSRSSAPFSMRSPERSISTSPPPIRFPLLRQNFTREIRSELFRDATQRHPVQLPMIGRGDVARGLVGPAFLSTPQAERRQLLQSSQRPGDSGRLSRGMMPGPGLSPALPGSRIERRDGHEELTKTMKELVKEMRDLKDTMRESGRGKGLARNGQLGGISFKTDEL